MASRSGAAPVPVEPGIRLHVVEVSLAKILAKYPKANTYVRASVCKKSADGKLVEVPQTAQRTEPRPSTDPAVDQWLTIPGPLTATNVLLVEVKTRDWAWLTKARVAMCTLDSDALALGSTEPGLDSWYLQHHPSSSNPHLCPHLRLQPLSNVRPHPHPHAHPHPHFHTEAEALNLAASHGPKMVQ